MRYPTLNVQNTSRDMLQVFKGYNHNLRIDDGEFYDMKNLSSDHFPVLSPRWKRGVYLSPEKPQGLIAKDSLCYIDGTDFVMNQYRVDMGLSEDETPKQLVSMGAYVIIMPDKKYINTLDLTDYGNVENTFTSGSTVSYELSTMEGDVYSDTILSDTEPESPENKDFWIDTSSSPHTLKQYSAASSMWVTVPTTYIKISSPNIAAGFSQYDGVTITGIDPALSQPYELEGKASVLWSAYHDEEGNGAADYIVVVGILDNATTQEGVEKPLTVKRSMPNLDYITEANNRLWGCRYGVAVNGDIVNEIYACKLGDFKNWNSFMGLSTDSWVGSCGTDGQFTGAITHLGYPIFFKESCMHKVYVSSVGAHQIQDTACRGVQKGCDRSLAIVNETLLYKSRSGICVYDGSLPEEASYVLGKETYSNAVAGAHKNKYYISMMDTEGKWVLFVYDALKGMWHKEDDLHADAFCSCREEMYCIDHDTGKIITMLGSGVKSKEPVEWMAETGELYLNSPDMKYISRMTVRMSLDIGAVMRFYAQYDLEDEWVPLCELKGTNLRSFSVSIRPRRCDHMKLRIEGKGMGKIYSITKTMEQGSDIS